MSLELKSPVFEEGGWIPEKYTCDGENVSPPLEWNGLPDGTASLALICDDPDAPMGTWVHWVVFNIPPETDGLPENVPPERELRQGGRQGINDFRKIGYGGPCPPGGTHRYYFKLYALDCSIGLPAGIVKDHLVAAMEGHILEQAILMGRYSR